jgi:ureidoglycolate lyase
MALRDSLPRIPVELLNAAAFAAYGEVLENKSAKRRRDFDVPFERVDARASTRLWVNRLPAYGAASIEIDLMECHPQSPQTFIPMQSVPCLVVVALSGDEGLLDPSTLRAFVSKGGQGVSYRPSVWHYAFTSLGGPNEVAVIMASTGSEIDTVITRLEPPVEIDLKPMGTS